MTEIFSQARMDRRLDIQCKILDHTVRIKQLDYVARATEPIHGLSLAELKKRYFAVGVGDDVTEIPFIDMIFVFSAVANELAVIKAIAAQYRDAAKQPDRHQFSLPVQTDFPDDKILKLLAQIHITTPCDSEPVFRVSEIPPDNLEADTGA